jgi:hypothetical protein
MRVRLCCDESGWWATTDPKLFPVGSVRWISEPLPSLRDLLAVKDAADAFALRLNQSILETSQEA